MIFFLIRQEVPRQHEAFVDTRRGEQSTFCKVLHMLLLTRVVLLETERLSLGVTGLRVKKKKQEHLNKPCREIATGFSELRQGKNDPDTKSLEQTVQVRGRTVPSKQSRGEQSRGEQSQANSPGANSPEQTVQGRTVPSKQSRSEQSRPNSPKANSPKQTIQGRTVPSKQSRGEQSQANSPGANSPEQTVQGRTVQGRTVPSKQSRSEQS